MRLAKQGAAIARRLLHALTLQRSREWSRPGWAASQWKARSPGRARWRSPTQWQDRSTQPDPPYCPAALLQLPMCSWIPLLLWLRATRFENLWDRPNVCMSCHGVNWRGFCDRSEATAKTVPIAVVCSMQLFYWAIYVKIVWAKDGEDNFISRKINIQFCLLSYQFAILIKNIVQIFFFY